VGGNAIAQAAIWAGIAGGVAAVIAIVPMTRNGARWVWRALQMRTGFSYGRYAKKFIREFGSYENPYLGEYEKIDLRSTYFFAHRSIQEFLAAGHAARVGRLPESDAGQAEPVLRREGRQPPPHRRSRPAPHDIAVSIGAQVMFWGAGIQLFDSDRHYYLRRPNEFVNMYDEPKSKHWVTSGSPRPGL